jgi:signal transduction histidine kinase
LVDDALQAAPLPAKVQVKVAATPTDLAVDVDPDQLRQVLVNLFTNAAQAMPQGGRIDVEAETLPSEATRVCVRDEGPGIDVEVQHRIFEALFTTKAKGSGLGLALCRRIMEAHGGSIDLQPSPAGATFVLVVPAPPLAPGTAA